MRQADAFVEAVARSRRLHGCYMSVRPKRVKSIERSSSEGLGGRAQAGAEGDLRARRTRPATAPSFEGRMSAGLDLRILG